MLLEDILGSRSKIKMLRFLFGNLERHDYSIEDIALGTRLSLGTVHPAMKQLTDDSRIISVRKIGRTRIYSLNRAHRLFYQLEALFRSEREGLRKLAEEFTWQLVSNEKGLKNIILFGSVASKMNDNEHNQEPGDIDLLFICGNDKERQRISTGASDLAESFLEEYDVVVSPICLTTNQVKDGLNRSRGFLRSALATGKVLYGEGEWLGM